MSDIGNSTISYTITDVVAVLRTMIDSHVPPNAYSFVVEGNVSIDHAPINQQGAVIKAQASGITAQVSRFVALISKSQASGIDSYVADRVRCCNQGSRFWYETVKPLVLTAKALQGFL